MTDGPQRTALAQDADCPAGTAGGRVSLVICTRNRAAQLDGCLAAVRRMRDHSDFELILVDNGSTDHTRQVLEGFAAAFPGHCRVVGEDRPGLGRARNRGWRAASGTIVAFTDDDCYVAPDHAAQITLAFDDPRIGFVGGKVVLHDPADVPETLTHLERVLHLPPGRFLPEGLIHGANMAFRREVLAEIGGFDDRLGAGTGLACEDVDACARAAFAGWTGRFWPGAVVRHHHGRKPADVPALHRQYALGRGAYFGKFLLRPDTRLLFARRTLEHLASGILRGRFRDRWYFLQGLRSMLRMQSDTVDRSIAA